MENLLLANEQSIHISVYFSVLFIVSLLELIAPLRSHNHSLRARWSGNLLLNVVNIVFQRQIFPFLTLAFAFTAQQQNWGIFNLLNTPPHRLHHLVYTSVRSGKLFAA